MKEYLKRIIGNQEDFSVESVKMPFFRLVFSPFNYVLDSGKAFFSSASVCSVALAIVAYALGTLFLCSFEAARENLFCSNSALNINAYLLLKMMFIIFFAVFFYQTLGKKGFSLKKLFVFNKDFLKLFGIFVLIAMLCMVPIFSFYLLYVRVPNPDWVIELLFFTVVSVGFLVPFVTFRFLSVIGLVLEERKVPSIVAIWRRTGENMFRIIFSIFFVLAFLLILTLNFYTNFVTYDANSFVGVFLVEYIYNMIAFLAIALFMGHIKAQTFYLFGEIEEDK